MQSPIPEPRLLARQFDQPGPQFFIMLARTIAVGRYCHSHQSTRATFAEGVLLFHLLDSGLQRYELQPFFRITDCKASLSSDRSATSFRSRWFSSRNCL